MHEHQNGFSRRRNRDGSYATFCRTCLLTVGSGKTEGELAETETQHICDEGLLKLRDGFRTHFSRRMQPV
jgi:hypothetical protein